jgi:hypothetical protein
MSSFNLKDVLDPMIPIFGTLKQTKLARRTVSYPSVWLNTVTIMVLNTVTIMVLNTVTIRVLNTVTIMVLNTN